MNAYVYQWSLRPRADLQVELRIEACDAIVARRTVVEFLERHGGGSWEIEAVSRSRDRTAASVPPGLAALLPEA